MIKKLNLAIEQLTAVEETLQDNLVENYNLASPGFEKAMQHLQSLKIYLLEEMSRANYIKEMKEDKTDE